MYPTTACVYGPATGLGREVLVLEDKTYLHSSNKGRLTLNDSNQTLSYGSTPPWKGRIVYVLGSIWWVIEHIRQSPSRLRVIGLAVEVSRCNTRRGGFSR